MKLNVGSLAVEFDEVIGARLAVVLVQLERTSTQRAQHSQYSAMAHGSSLNFRWERKSASDDTLYRPLRLRTFPFLQKKLAPDDTTVSPPEASFLVHCSDAQPLAQPLRSCDEAVERPGQTSLNSIGLTIRESSPLWRPLP